ncbi:MAG: phosphotransferase [Chloroflexota bacterium]|nr:MAG: hypothetical protein DIU68_05400 [Chloroflexota bacterium]
MNLVESYLHANRQRFDLRRYGLDDGVSCLVLTPRFRASRHVVFLVMPRNAGEPALVAKVARLPGASASLEREASNLRALEALIPDDDMAAPRLLAFDSVGEWPLLLETALTGPLLTPEVIRARHDDACRAVLDWLLRLHGKRAEAVDYERLIDAPLRRFAAVFPLTRDERMLLERTWELTLPLTQTPLPVFMEHGDLSHPNIVWRRDGRIGVIDWELADPNGLPAQDLFFFLTYAGFASADAGNTGDYTGAFRQTFFGAGAWALPLVEAYASAVGLSSPQLTALFVACWARYVVGLLDRLEDVPASGDVVPEETAAWLRNNRYSVLWRYAVDHVDELGWV